MKIEAGKSYRNGRGEKIDISHCVFCFKDQKGRIYTEQGTAGNADVSQSLVYEWVDPVTVECIIDKNDYDLIYLRGSIRHELQPFIGKKTKVTIEVIE